MVDLAHRPTDLMERLIDTFKSFPVVRSLLVLRLVHAPTLDFLVVTRWTSETPRAISQALRKRGWNGALLRSDAPREYGVKPPGGNVYSLSNLVGRTEQALKEGRVVILMEPWSRFRDVYSGNIMVEKDSDWLCWEVVGPGFDLGDLNRGYSRPHERFETYRGADLEDAGLLTPLDIRCHEIVNRNAYKRSWVRRLARIGRLAGAETDQEDKLIFYARDFLQREQCCLLLDAAQDYMALGYDLLCRVHSRAYEIQWKLSRYQTDFQSCILGFSLIDRRGLVFWDACSFGRHL